VCERELGVVERTKVLYFVVCTFFVTKSTTHLIISCFFSFTSESCKNRDGAGVDTKSKRRGLFTAAGGEGPLVRVDAPTPLSTPQTLAYNKRKEGKLRSSRRLVAKSTFKGRQQKRERDFALHHHSANRLHVLSGMHGRVKQKEKKIDN
jgi:hypothetical protein